MKLLILIAFFAVLLGYPNGYHQKEKNITHHVVVTIAFVKRYVPIVQSLLIDTIESTQNIGTAAASEVEK